MQTKRFEYGPYELVCAAMPAAGGGFSATLSVAISHGDASEKTDVPLAGAPVFKTEDEALEHAAAQGRDWVDEHG